MHVRKRLFQLAALPVAIVPMIGVGVAPASAEVGVATPSADIVADGVDSAGITYKKAYTGRDCYTEYWWDGQQLQPGTRCAQAYNEYVSYNSVLWRIDQYRIRYDVSDGLDFGPHNNERPWKVGSGYGSGTQSWDSPDAGPTNTGYFLRNIPGSAYTYKGQTVVNIDAWPDIPGVPDPRLDLDTATF